MVRGKFYAFGILLVPNVIKPGVVAKKLLWQFIMCWLKEIFITSSQDIAFLASCKADFSLKVTFSFTYYSPLLPRSSFTPNFFFFLWGRSKRVLMHRKRSFLHFFFWTLELIPQNSLVFPFTVCIFYQNILGATKGNEATAHFLSNRNNKNNVHFPKAHHVLWFIFGAWN